MPCRHHSIVRNCNELPFREDFAIEPDLERGDVPQDEDQDNYLKAYFPGNPQGSTTSESSLLASLLKSELCSSDLDDMAPYLWMLSQQSSGNVSPLHRQIVKDRRIIITEDPRLHLVWINDRIFVKPLPRYLLSHRFWKNVMVDQDCCVWSAALGFLRTYTLLIKHESDFEIAQRPEARLIPNGIKYGQLMQAWVELKESIDDTHVSPRYLYGELRLARLNFYCKFILRKRYFHRLHGQYSSYFGQYYGPILFLIGFISIFLNAMQVELGIEQLSPGVSYGFLDVCKWFGILTLVVGAVLGIGLFAMLAYMFIAEWSHAIRHRLRQGNSMQRCFKGVEV